MEKIEQKEFLENSIFAGDYDLISLTFSALTMLENSMKGEVKDRKHWFSEYERIKKLAAEKLESWELLAKEYYVN